MNALPLLLVPGLMCDHTVWEPLFPWLTAGRACTVVDHGQADALPQMAHQLLASAPPQFLMAGHSMGARVVLEVLRLAPERVRGVALMDTGFLPKPAGAAGDDEAAKRFALLQIAKDQGVRAMAQQWVQGMVHPDRLGDADLIERILAKDVISPETGEIIAKANEEIDATLLAKLEEAGVKSIETLYVNDLDRGAFIANTLRADETRDRTAARVAIYRMMRPGEPPTEEAVEILFNGLFYSDDRYDLSAVGRMKFNRRMGRPDITESKVMMTSLPAKLDDVIAYLAERNGVRASLVADQLAEMQFGARAAAENLTEAEAKEVAAKLNALSVKTEVRDQLTLSPRDLIDAIAVDGIATVALGDDQLHHLVERVVAHPVGGQVPVVGLRELVDGGEQVAHAHAEAERTHDRPVLCVGGCDQRRQRLMAERHIGVDPQQPVGVIVVEELPGEAVAGRGHVG